MRINRRNFLYTLGAIASTPLHKGYSRVARPSIQDVSHVEKFSFGSCNRHFLEQPLWSRLSNESPDFFMWMGDAVYCDTEDPKIMKDVYQKQKKHPGYSSFANQTPIIGIWDDHDYGQNNANISNPIKDVARNEFLNFVDEPYFSSRYFNDGIYTTYEFGKNDEKVKIILLDLRYNKSENSLLGEVQWQWLEDQLATSDAKVNIIVSSVPFVAPLIFKVEHWRRYPHEFQRLNNIIDLYHPSGLFFLTGDQHMAAQFIGQTPGGYPLYEFMSSGLTHHAKKLIRPYLNRMYGKGNYFIDQNYGNFSFDWSHPDVSIRVELKGKDTGNHLVRNFIISHGRPLLI